MRRIDEVGPGHWRSPGLVLVIYSSIRCYCIDLWINIIMCKRVTGCQEKSARLLECRKGLYYVNWNEILYRLSLIEITLPNKSSYSIK